MTSEATMSFAERMMRKMGHEAGKGLGKDGAGIVDPIEALTVHKGTGLGYQSAEASANAAAWAAVTVGDGDDWGRKKSNTISVWNLPRGTEPGYLYRLFDDDDKTKITEIVIPRRNPERLAFVMFATETDAEVASDKYHDRIFGSQDLKLRVEITDEDCATKERDEKKGLLLSDFLRDRDEMSTVESRTVVVSKLPEKNVLKVLKHLLKQESFHCTDDGDDPYQTAPGQEAGTAIVRFPTSDAAKEFADIFNGSYTKNSTIYAKPIPDEDGPARMQPVETSTTTMLYVSNLPLGYSAEFVRSVFSPVELKDVNVPTKRGTFAFVYVPKDQVKEVLKQFPKRRGGRIIYVQEGRKKDGRRDAKKPRVPDGQYLAADDPVRKEFFTPLAPVAPRTVESRANTKRAESAPNEKDSGTSAKKPSVPIEPSLAVDDSVKQEPFTPPAPVASTTVESRADTVRADTAPSQEISDASTTKPSVPVEPSVAPEDPAKTESCTPPTPVASTTAESSKDITPAEQAPIQKHCDPKPAPVQKHCDAYLSNLAYAATEKDVRELFAGFTINRVSIKKGFAFVGLQSEEDLEKARTEMNGKVFLGRKVFVSKARSAATKG